LASKFVTLMRSIFTARCYVKHSIAVERRLSVRLSTVCNVAVFIVLWAYVLGSYFESILITRMISLGSSHLEDPTSLI